MTNTSAARPVLNGRYELHRRIARGGMADVFLAKDQLLDRPVAVKVLFPQYAAEPTFVARFRREAQAAANLNHPSIVAVYDWGEHDGTYFIVMEYVEGQTLADLIAAEGPLHPDRAADIAMDVAVALGFAHRNGTVHRDVKPGNIMINQAGQIKVADFGIARAFGGADDELTQTGSVMGTASYFSPEQAQGKTVDPRSDLYSLGVVLFEMVVGETPFLGNTPVAIAYKHVQEPAPRAAQRNPSVPASMDAIIARLLQKLPADRYPASEEVRAELRRFREGQPLTSAPAAVVPPTAATAAFDPSAVEPTMAMPIGTGTTNAAMPVRGPDTASSRALIDTSRAVPASAARSQQEPVEEYYEPPSRTGVFVVMLGVLLVGLVALIFYVTELIGQDDGEVANGNLVAVPTVTGEGYQTAKNRLEDAQFIVDTQFEQDDEVPENRVIRQDPEGQSEAEERSVVTLWVSQAAETVVMPRLVGMTETQADEVLKASGLRGSTEREFSEDIPIGNVIRTNPEDGEDIGVDFPIEIVVSLGPSQVAIPSVVNLSAADGFAVLEQAGFTQIVRVDEGSGTVPAGQIIDTVPKAGTDYAQDQSITLLVSTGPQAVVMTELRGKDPTTAQTWIADAGLQVQIVEVDLNEGDERIGFVIAQDPAPGNSTQQGATVKIEVGRLSTTPTVTTPEETTSSTEEETVTTETTQPEGGEGGEEDQ